ncbi:potassium channel family protein [Labilibaculum sp. K2S]|uniref:potassium channel family protein n=1 Tax=Labilibaculum sp. K2S TaxID=3056386 RepID=UPI0025A355C6|nr:potassium channel family protein [Labilibaculum sp. K2S]MDM8162237.1 potassium channel family protein [Labilibaculum sp. K2S]
MNEFREQWLKDREKEDLALFEKIKDNPKPEILDLWRISEKRFIQWRKLHDFPRLLVHFDKSLKLFTEWKKDYELTNELIIANGEISPFLEHKKLSKKNKTLYLTKQKWNDEEKTFVAYEKIEGERKHFETTYDYSLIKAFTPYLDWLKVKGESQDILYINSRSAPGHEMERVWIHADVYATKTDFELLKMGGIQTPVNGFGILLRGKRIEFANLCGLKFNGNIHFGEEGNLSCSYCACDNWIADDFDMPLLNLEHCTITNFTLNNSKLQQWRFYDCEVSGDFINSKLYNVQIYGGNFNPVFQDCTLYQAEILHESNIKDNNLNAYKAFKKMYQSQGDDDIAKDYFIQENEFIRKRLKGWNFFTKTLSYYYWEYGRKPHRIIYLSLAIIIVFGLIYWINYDLISANTAYNNFNLGDSLYFSTITFTTLGYGDFSPVGWLKVLSAIEAFSGVVNMGFLIAGYTNNKY